MKVKVERLMTPNAKFCATDTDLASAAVMMWDNDCGALPIVDEHERVVGMITDRDIAIATATKGRIASHIPVGEVMTGQRHVCAPDDDIQSALETMRRERVRRLPVVDQDGRLQGILSINDLILQAERVGGAARTPGVSYDDVMITLQALCEHRGAARAAKA
ncbi:MAG: Inosine-5'-monophosphate dehydrogenase [Acidobacteria bacterium]|nr:Inosine-5'-monophosphate dehydrogenase [Acidobacteriota bacterium]